MGAGTPDVTQVETMNPEQKKFLGVLLDVFPQVMAGQTIGETYKGSGKSVSKPFTLPSGPGKGATSSPGPSGGPGPDGSHGNKDVNPVVQALTGPIVSPYTEGQTGNYPRTPRL